MGETFVVEFGKKHKKIAMLVPYKKEVKKIESLAFMKASVRFHIILMKSVNR